jgi:anti-anti-sigma factor
MNSMPAPGSFHYEVEVSEAESPEAASSAGSHATIILCHGHLVSETRNQLEKMFKETPFQGRVVIDLAGVDYVDSAGLGALIRLKLSAAKDDGVSVRFINVAPGLMTLLRISNLEDWFVA